MSEDFVMYRPGGPNRGAVDAVRHPRLAAYAYSARRFGDGGRVRAAHWHKGYLRFGDEFENILAADDAPQGRGPVAYAQYLEDNLDDRWKLVGLRFSELGPGTKAAWATSYSTTLTHLLEKLLAEAPDDRYGEVIAWSLSGTGRRSVRHDMGGWVAPLFRPGPLAARIAAPAWSVADLLPLMDAGVSFVQVGEAMTLGLTKPSQAAAFLLHGIPPEYALC